MQLNPRECQNSRPQLDPVLLGLALNLHVFVCCVSHGRLVLAVHTNRIIRLGYPFIFHTYHLVPGNVFLVRPYFCSKWHDRLSLRSFLQPHLTGADCGILGYNIYGSYWMGNSKVLNYTYRRTCLTILGAHFSSCRLYVNDLDSESTVCLLRTALDDCRRYGQLGTRNSHRTHLVMKLSSS